MQRRQLSDEVASYLRQSIMAGELGPGTSVRAEAVGEALDVSATPVREALHALRAEGFLELVPRRGFTVRALTATDIRDIFEAHALVAGELAARAAERVTDAQVADLVEQHAELMRAAEEGDTQRLEQLNDEFHRRIYLAAGSERLRWALGNFVKYVPSAFYAQIDGWPETTAEDHSAVCDAVVAHDADGARAAMAQHIRNAGEKLADYFERRQAP
ncbi:GntR family transcriptional regulator [Leucobacter rhizosphaerae]|uniref:GntR family transcriptional regulator n=1 Tax=Leucobacter rhizosphaerae TaxID=2932245 RepID=A0ABY4FTN2_9MICO|nr:GntR family transcriptional regulator [Leucobacter rhizosphaerae]UOQ59661.1 GntR family transcriptional regulator [Leucobacter rhizosphaerae]